MNAFVFLFQVEQIWDDVPSKPENESKLTELSIPELLTKVATDANEGNRYVNHKKFKKMKISLIQPFETF